VFVSELKSQFYAPNADSKQPFPSILRRDDLSFAALVFWPGKLLTATVRKRKIKTYFSR
jgi:hypothetical protein